MRRFGGQTVTFVSVNSDVTDLDRYLKPKPDRTQRTDVPGCLFRSVIPTYRDEKLETPTDLVIDEWRCTAPPAPAVLNAKAKDEVIFNGITYQIQVGPRIFFDLGGRPFKVTLICQERTV